ncbi:hypothetical protein CSA37_00315 [Candidatus Fermentibacteria bacterium]|nr:MAG: hypothetical protein CSA37_00315 [Candidatus Fermentibacteria bacterium]
MKKALSVLFLLSLSLPAADLDSGRGPVDALVVINVDQSAASPDRDRGAVDIFLGAGVWVPGMLGENSELAVGPMFLAGVETPMADGDQFRLSAGYAMCGSDRVEYDGIGAVMLNLAYRSYPFYRPYAGPRGLEPFIGVTGGGLVAWDNPETGDSENTGGGMLGAEIGTRMKAGESAFLDISLAAEWVPTGSALAGEEKEDLSGIRIQGSLVF